MKHEYKNKFSFIRQTPNIRINVFNEKQIHHSNKSSEFILMKMYIKTNESISKTNKMYKTPYDYKKYHLQVKYNECKQKII